MKAIIYLSRIWVSRRSSAQRGRKTYSQGQWGACKSICENSIIMACPPRGGPGMMQEQGPRSGIRALQRGQKAVDQETPLL